MCNESLLRPRISIGLLAIAFASATVGCAGWVFSTGHSLSRAPYYKTFGDTINPQEGGVGHFPVVLHTDVAVRNPWDRLGGPQPLLNEIDSYLDSLGWSAPLVATSLPAKGAPVVDVRSSEESALEDHSPPMMLSITKPGAGWRDALRQIADEANVEYVLCLSLGLSEYSIRNKGVFSKEVELGTGYTMPISWTSEIEKPVKVLHIKGMLLDREGNIVRAGAEGITGKDAPFLISLFDLETTISSAEARRLLNEVRRVDLPGQPVAWKVATQNLVAQLLMRNEDLR